MRGSRSARSTAVTPAPRRSATCDQPPGAAPRSTQRSPGRGATPSQASASSNLRNADDGASQSSATGTRPPGQGTGQWLIDTGGGSPAPRPAEPVGAPPPTG